MDGWYQAEFGGVVEGRVAFCVALAEVALHVEVRLLGGYFEDAGELGGEFHV